MTIATEVQAHLQSAIPRLLQQMWQPVAPFLMRPTPGRALISSDPVNGYCQKESLLPQSIVFQASTGTNVHAMVPMSQTLYPFVISNVSYGSQCTVTLHLQQVSNQSLVWDSPLRLSIKSVNLFELLCPRSVHFVDAVQHKTINCSLPALEHVDPLCPPLVSYGSAAETLLIISLQPDKEVVIEAGQSFEIRFEYLSPPSRSDINDWLVNSCFVVNQYTTDAYPIHSPGDADRHKIVVDHINPGHVIAIKSIEAMTDSSVEPVRALAASYPWHNQQHVMYSELRESDQLCLQLIGVQQVKIHWLSVLVEVCQAELASQVVVPSIGQWQAQHPAGWHTTIGSHFSSYVPAVEAPTDLVDCTALVTPLMLLKDFEHLSRYLEWFVVKQPMLAKKIAAIQLMDLQQRSRFNQGAFESLTVLVLAMPKALFDSSGDCQLFHLALQAQLRSIMPINIHLRLEVTWLD